MNDTIFKNTKYHKTNGKTSLSVPLYIARPLKNVYYAGIGKRGRFVKVSELVGFLQ